MVDVVHVFDKCTGILTGALYTYPCTTYQSEVDELWSWDPITYTWTFVNLTIHAPLAREQHASAVVNGDLYIFGGKAREFPSSADTVFNDIWKLEVRMHKIFTVTH